MCRRVDWFDSTIGGGSAGFIWSTRLGWWRTWHVHVIINIAQAGRAKSVKKRRRFNDGWPETLFVASTKKPFYDPSGRRASRSHGITPITFVSFRTWLCKPFYWCFCCCCRRYASLARARFWLDAIDTGKCTFRNYTNNKDSRVPFALQTNSVICNWVKKKNCTYSSNIEKAVFV